MVAATPVLWLVIVAAGLSGVACADDVRSSTGASTPRTVRFSCDDGSEFRAYFTADGSVATLTFANGESLTLPRQVSGSGYLYETPQHSLRGKGDTATWAVGGHAPAQCRATPATPRSRYRR
jgi:membrane-bound inhibitor of C-type lysozyme